MCVRKMILLEDTLLEVDIAIYLRQNLKFQCVVVAKCQKKLNCPFLIFLKNFCFAKIFIHCSTPLHNKKNKLHFRKCLKTV